MGEITRSVLMWKRRHREERRVGLVLLGQVFKNSPSRGGGGGGGIGSWEGTLLVRR